MQRPGPELTRRGFLTAAAAAAAVIVVPGGIVRPAPARAASTVPVPPDGQVAAGVHLDWSSDTPADFVARSGFSPAQYGAFVGFPLTSAGKAALSRQADAVAAVGSRLFLTVEPSGGLATVTRATARDLARTLAAVNARGVAVLLRFAHEMNGSWYPWGQQPAAYRAAFTKVANAVHGLAPGSATVWSPNYAGGYPYRGGRYSVAAGSADFTALDTNRDGLLSIDDDPYARYYPGDGAVDWVGLTLYHWGNAWPWGENEVPEAGKLAAQLTGTYSGLAGDETAVPDFYQVYAAGRGKPMALAETAALYNEAPAEAGAAEIDIKTGWLGQVFDPAFATQFPALKCINWFEQRKYETETGSVVDWRVTADPALRDTVAAYLASPRYGGR